MIIYVISAASWLRPITMIKYLIGNARNAKSNDERRDIILALEEIALNAILKGYISTAEKIISSRTD